MKRAKGKRAIVIGAAGHGNMGQSIARRLAYEGARVLVAGRHQPELDSLARELHGHAFVCDITQECDNVALAEAAVATMGGLDIAVNATGWGLLKPFTRTSEDELRRMTDLQFIGPFLFWQAMLAVMADIAAAVAWLISDECFMTGENLQVTGGLSLRGNPSRDEVDAFVETHTGKPRPRPWD